MLAEIFMLRCEAEARRIRANTLRTKRPRVGSLYFLYFSRPRDESLRQLGTGVCSLCASVRP